MAVGGLYETEDIAGRAMQGMAGAGQTLGAIRQGSKTTVTEEKTAGGALQAAAGGAIAGSAFGPPWGTVAGAAVGLISYYL